MMKALLKFHLFPNLTMDGQKLIISLRKPFDRFMPDKKHSEWLGIVSQLQTEYGGDIRIFRELVTSSNASYLLKVASARLLSLGLNVPC